MNDPIRPADETLPTRQQLADVGAWLREHERQEQAQREFQQAYADLENVLEIQDELPVQELELRWEIFARASAEAEQDIAEDLQNRYTQRVTSLKKAKRRRRWRKNALVFGGMLAAVLLCGAGLLYGWHRHQVSTVVADVEALLEADDLRGAEDYLDELRAQSPYLADAARVRDVQRRLDTRIRDEEERRTRFLAALAAAEAAGVAAADTVSLTNAKKLAKTAEEFQAVEVFEAKIIAHVEQTRQAEEQKLRAQLGVILQGVADLEREASADDAPAHAVRLLNELRQFDLHAQARTLARETEDARRRIRAVQEAYQAGQRTRDSESQITASVGDDARFTSALQAYAAAHPADPLVPDLRGTLAEQSLWVGVDAWNELVQKLEGRDLHRVSPDQAQEVLQQIAATEAKYPGYRLAREVSLLKPYLEAIARRKLNGRSAVEPVRSLFTNPLVFNLWMVQVRPDKRYYTPVEVRIDETQDLVPINFLANAASQRRSITVQADTIQSQGRAPQSVLAENVLRELNRLSGDLTNWESVFSAIILLVMNQPDVDPVLHATLLRQVLQTAVEGSHSMAQGFTRHLELLQDATFSTTCNWMDPDDEEGSRNRAQARLVIDSLPDPVLARDEVVKVWQGLRTLRYAKLRWIGWLKRSGGGEWKCLSASVPAGAGTLVVVRQGSASVETLTIGSLKDGQLQVTASPSVLLAGRPVYLESAPAGPPPIGGGR